MTKKIALVACLFYIPLIQAQTLQHAFHLNEMPTGKEITLPKATTTYAPLSHNIKLSSTDTPQILKITSTRLNQSFPPKNIEITVQDKENKKTQKTVIKPGASFLYTFSALSTIEIKFDKPEEIVGKKLAQSDDGTRLLLESDKPMTVGW